MLVTVLKGIVRSRLAESRPVKLFSGGEGSALWETIDVGTIWMPRLAESDCLVWRNVDVSFGKIWMSRLAEL